MACRFLLLLLLTPALHAQDVSPAVQALYADAQQKQAANQTDAAIADYREITEQVPTLTAGWNNLGRLLYNAGRYGEAIAALKQALALEPGLPPAELMLGASLLKLDRPAEAQPSLVTAIEALPGDRFAHVTYARVLTRLNRPQEAVAQLEAVLATDANDQEAWYLVGKLHLELSKQAFTKVQELGPDTLLAHELQGELEEDLSNTPGAITEYKQAVALAPSSSEPLEHLANVYWKTGDWPHAVEQLRLLLAKEPGNCYAHWKLANALDEEGEPVEAGLKEVNTALAQCPALAQARAERARLLLRSGKPAEAVPDLKAAETAAPDEPSVQRLLAQAYRALGDKLQADAANRKFVELEQAERAGKERKAARVVQATQ